MRRTGVVLITVFLAGLCVFAQKLAGRTVTVQGWVIDSACAYTKSLDKPVSPDCARACAKNGSPLVILRDDGTVFIPIDNKTPASSQNPKLLPFAGQRVQITGTEYVRGGSHALVIRTISPVAK